MKKRTFFILLFILSLFPARAQYWQQEVHYQMDVILHEQEKTLDGFEKLRYINHSPDTLRYIWFHVWPNAYKNDKTAFADQTLRNDDTRFYFANSSERGYINRLDFRVNGKRAESKDHPEYIDIIQLMLPQALAPGETAIIETPFHVKLPFNFSRGGFNGSSFQITQWYPKPAVYDAKGWHPMPYLDQGEFYSEFGSFDVSITVPKDMVVAATGVLQNEEEKAWLKTLKQARTGQQTASKEIKTIRYKQDRVHDFAWFADRRFIVDQDSCVLPGGKTIEVFSYYTPDEAKTWKNSLAMAKAGVRFYSSQLADYPYEVLSVVQGPAATGGGMEYPTITVIEPMVTTKELETTIVHEIGHNWFYGILATNERAHPWMDEGLNSFYERRYMQAKYGVDQGEEILFRAKAFRGNDQPVALPADSFSAINYALSVYHKTAAWMEWMEKKIGSDRMNAMMRDYYTTWQFRHPQPEDFYAIMQKHMGAEAAPAYALVNQQGILPGTAWKGNKIVSVLKPRTFIDYVKLPTKQVVVLSPAIGANSYDRLMIGGLISNYKLPPNHFQYLLIPLYGTGSKQLTGLGQLRYTAASKGLIHRMDFFVNGSRFSMNEFPDSAGRKIKMQFSKIVPVFRLTLKEKDPRSTAQRYLQWKTFFIHEEQISLRRDTVITGTDTTLLTRYNTPGKSRYINQLRIVWENDRALYPYSLQLQAEQAEDFIRPTLTAHYFFNYPRSGGLQLRFFAGAFVYTKDKTPLRRFANDRYALNMTGANGYEDYTYSDFFAGRNRFDGWESQQIMMRDGGFKVRTDLLSDKIGKTDEWLMALNLTTSIPDKINPLSVLPFKIPIRLFFDLGTYADPWKRGSTEDRFLYDAGIHLPLFNESVNIYIPVLYSGVYGDYIKSTIPTNRFMKTISFSIDFMNRDTRKTIRSLDF